MKSLLTALVVSTMTVPAMAAAAHDTCLQAADYEGCMRVQQNGGVASSGNDELANLRNAMKQVAARLSAGTSLRDSSEVFRPVTDAIAVVPSADQDSLAYKEAVNAARYFDVWQSAVSLRIKATDYGAQRQGLSLYNCDLLKQSADAWDRVAPYGNSINFTYKRGFLGIMGSACRVQGSLPETRMLPVVLSTLRSGAIDPKVLAAQEKEAEEQRARAELDAWERYLADNPGMAEWAKANPTLGEAKKKEWLAENPPVTQGEANGKIGIFNVNPWRDK